MFPRRTIEELLARYRFEPTVKDVFVEGDLDQAVLSRFLRTSGKHASGVFRIETVEVPRYLLIDREYGSERGRLNALARQLEHELGKTAPVRCIIDRDFDAISGFASDDSSSLVLRTDFSTIEMYFFDSTLLDQFLSDFLRIQNLDPLRLLDGIASALISASCMFAANHSLGLQCGHIKLSRCCHYDRIAGLSFDAEEYMIRYLNKGSAMGRREEFETEIDRIGTLAPDDPRLWIRGRDFLALLAFCLRGHGIDRELCTQRTLEGAFTIAVSSEYLEQFKLFQALGYWYSTP